MRGEDQPGAIGHGVRRGEDVVGEHLDEERVVEVAPKFDQFGSVGTGRAPGPVEILGVLRAARVSTPRGRGEYRCTPNAVVAHGRDRVFDVRLPVAVAEVDRDVQLSLQCGDQVPVDPVDRRHPAEVQVVLRHVVEPFRWHVAAPGDVLQERPHLLRSFWPSEGQQ